MPIGQLLNGIIQAFPSVAGTINGSQSAGGGTQSGGGSSYGYNTAQSINRSQSSGYSNIAGREATASAANAAAIANKYAKDQFKDVMEYNAREAQKQREWEEMMANTIYTRSVKNMREAGINPILAAGMGLSGASVGSGAAASVSQPQTFMGQTFAEQNSANQAWSAGNSTSYGENSSSYGYSGSSWNNSESGLATGIRQMQELLGGMANGINAGKIVKDATEAIYNAERKLNDTIYNNSKTYREENSSSIMDWFGNKFHTFLANNGIGAKTWKDLPTNSETYLAIRNYLDNGWKGLNKHESALVHNAMNKGLVTKEDFANWQNRKG